MAAFDCTYLLQSLGQHVDETDKVKLIGSPWSSTVQGQASVDLDEAVDAGTDPMSATKATDMLLGLFWKILDGVLYRRC